LLFFCSKCFWYFHWNEQNFTKSAIKFSLKIEKNTTKLILNACSLTRIRSLLNIHRLLLRSAEVSDFRNSIVYQNILEFEIPMNYLALVDWLIVSHNDLVKYRDNIVFSEFISVDFHVIGESALITQFCHEIDVICTVIEKVEFRNILTLRN